VVYKNKEGFCCSSRRLMGRRANGHRHPVVLGAGKRLFEGFAASVELEHLGVRPSPFASFIDYRVNR
jgi:hypothetical protein